MLQLRSTTPVHTHLAQTSLSVLLLPRMLPMLRTDCWVLLSKRLLSERLLSKRAAFSLVIDVFGTGRGQAGILGKLVG